MAWEKLPEDVTRLKDREDVKIEDLPEERATAKDKYGYDSCSITDLLDVNNPSLLTMTSCIGIDIGCTMALIGHNIKIMQSLEIARLDMASRHDRTIYNDMIASFLGPIDFGDVDLNGLYSIRDN